MSLTKILEEIKANQVFATTNVENEPRSTYQGRIGRQQRAIENLKDLKDQYRTELRNSAMFIVVVGAARDTFVSTGTEGFGLFSTNPDELYEDLTNRINPALYKKNVSTQDVFQVLGRLLEDKAQELGVVEYPQLTFKQEYRKNISTKEDVLELVRKVMNKQVGAELAGLQAVYSVTNKAIEKNHASKTTPILLATSNEELALDLVAALPRITKNVFLVAAGKTSKALKSVPGILSLKEVTQESVEQTLATIKNSIKK